MTKKNRMNALQSAQNRVIYIKILLIKAKNVKNVIRDVEHVNILIIIVV